MAKKKQPEEELVEEMDLGEFAEERACDV